MMSSSPPPKETPHHPVETPHDDPRLSYLLTCTPHPAVSRLLTSSLTEIPPPPITTNLPPAGSTTSLGSDHGFVIKDRWLGKPTGRLLLVNGPCSCLHIHPNTPLSRWGDSVAVETSLSEHLVHSHRSPLSKANSKQGIAKSSSTSKIDTFGRLYKGHPYEKTDIPFHFQHLEAADMATDYAALYRKAYTYPTMEDTNAASDYTSYSAPSVIEPKLLTFGVSKPKVAESTHKTSKYYNFHHMDKKPSSTQLMDKKTPLSTHSLDGIATQSVSILEVYHGQTLGNLQLSSLPHPDTPDSPPTSHHTPSHEHTNSYSVQLKDLIDATTSLKPAKKHNVRWASHKYPTNLSPSASVQGLPVGYSEASPTHIDLPRQTCRRIPMHPPMLTRKIRAASFPHDIPSTGLLDLSATSFTKITPKAKETLPSKTRHSQNTKLRMDKGTSSSHSDHVTLGIQKKNRSKHLMPSSKALVPKQLGIFSTTSLAQKSMDYL